MEEKLEQLGREDLNDNPKPKERHRICVLGCTFAGYLWHNNGWHRYRSNDFICV